MRASTITGSIALALLLAACDATPTAAPAESANAPTFNFTNGPANPGPVVVRQEDTRLFAVFSDPARGLISVHGLDPDDFLPCGTGTSLFGEIDRQVVDTSSEVESLARLFREREARVSVYDTGEIPGTLPEFCVLFAGPLKIAEGVEDFMTTSNDFGDENHRRSFRFVGELEGTDGATIRYTEVQNFVSGRGFVVEDILLRPVNGS